MTIRREYPEKDPGVPPWSSAQAGEEITLAPFLEFLRKPLSPVSRPFDPLSPVTFHPLVRPRI